MVYVPLVAGRVRIRVGITDKLNGATSLNREVLVRRHSHTWLEEYLNHLDEELERGSQTNVHLHLVAATELLLAAQIQSPCW